MQLKKIYIIGIIIITLAVLYLYINRKKEHNKELDRIKRIEERLEEKKNELNEIRSRTTACSVPNLDDPRSCYFESGYRCTWNEEAERCDQK